MKKNRKTKIVMIIVLILFLICGYFVFFKDKVGTNNDNRNFKSIKEVLKYMDCKYIKEVESSIPNYYKDIYITSKVPLYDDKEVYENFYNNLTLYMAEALDYKSFLLMDEKNNITIAVECSNLGKTISKTVINGDQYYFSKIKSQRGLLDYTNITNIDITINSSILTKVNANSWNSKNINLGTIESTFANYDIYFDEGYKIRNINNEIFNIVFTDKYGDSVVNDIKTNTSLEEVISKLGQPSIGTIDSTVIGYRTKNMYIFFSGSDISAYKYIKYDTTPVSKIFTDFVNDKDAAKLIDETIKIWPDYDSFERTSKYAILKYSLKGVEIKFNYDTKNGISIYNNYYGNITDKFSITDAVKKDEKLPENIYFVNDNLIYQNEMSRIYGFALDSAAEMNDKFALMIKDGLKIISLNNDVPNYEINEDVYTVKWLNNNDTFAYSIKNKGIYTYNITTKKKDTLIEGKDEYQIIKYENGILTYDEKEIKINL